MNRSKLVLLILAAGLSLTACHRTDPPPQGIAWKVFRLQPYSLDASRALSQKFFGDTKLPDPNDASVYFTQDPRTGDFSLSKSLKEYFNDQPSSLPSPEE